MRSVRGPSPECLCQAKGSTGNPYISPPASGPSLQTVSNAVGSTNDKGEIGTLDLLH